MNRLLQEEQTAAYTMWIHCLANIRTTNDADPLFSPSRPSSRSLFRSPALQSKSRNCEEKTAWSGTRETPLVEEKGKVTHRSRRKSLPASLRFPQDSRWTHSCVAGVIAGTCLRNKDFVLIQVWWNINILYAKLADIVFEPNISFEVL